MPQRSRRRHSLLKQRLIKMLHQFSGGVVVNFPERRDHARGAGVHESASQTDQTFASDVFAKTSAARAQHDEVGGQVQVVDVVQTQKSVLRTRSEEHTSELQSRFG